MRIAIPALTLSSFLAFQVASDSRLLTDWCHVPTSPPMLHVQVHPPAFTLNEVVRACALKHRIPTAMIRGVIAAESAFHQSAVSNKGAIGLMQLMPATAAEYGADPANPEQNVEAGAHYLRWLLNRYRNNRDRLRCAIAAYNAGPGNVDRYRGVPPFAETRAYVKRVLANTKRYGSHEEWRLSD